MNITKEHIDNVNAILKVTISKEDYEEQVNEELKKYQKQASMPGFRKGKMPLSLIRKMYGKNILIQKINDILSKAVSDYIRDNELQILGEPLPREQEQTDQDWDNQEEFEFTFDIGLAPEFSLELNSQDTIPYYKIKINKELVDSRVEAYQNQFGQFTPVDTVSDNELLTGRMVEVDENGNEIENGITKDDATISLNIMKDDDIKQQFNGAKVDDTITINVKKAFPNDTDIASLLNISKEEAQNLDSNFRVTIKSISRFEKAPVDETLFNKIYGEGQVNSEDEFREKIAEELEQEMEQRSDAKFFEHMKDYLIGKIDVELPEAFLKRWIKKQNEKMSEEEIEQNFDNYRNDIKWQLIKNKLVKEHDLSVSEEEVKELTRELTKMQFQSYGLSASNITDELLDGQVNEALNDKNTKKQLYERKYEDKVKNLVKEKVTLETKEITREDFNELDEQKNNEQ